MGNGNKFLKSVLSCEKRFSCHRYDGRGRHDFEVLEGKIPVMISAPHAVNHCRDGRIKYADKLTGGIAIFLHKVTGCYVIFSARTGNYDPNYTPNPNGENLYQSYLTEYVKNKHIEVLIDLHGAQEERDFAVEIGTAPALDEDGRPIQYGHPSLNGRDYIADLVTYMFEYTLRGVHQPAEKKKVAVNQVFCASDQNTVTKYVSENSETACIQLEVNSIYRSPKNEYEFSRFIKGLVSIIRILGKIDWRSNHVKVYRLWPSNVHKPQDKVELDLRYCNEAVQGWRSFSVCSFVGEPELVKLHAMNSKEKEQIEEHISRSNAKDLTINYICLTNRLIEKVCGKEWMPTEENAFSICGIPIILYETASDSYEIGLPNASRIDGISLSSALHDSLLPFADTYEFAVYNRFTDSLYYVDINNSDYCDKGRVMDSTGKPAKKVMLPRYYRRLLGYLDEPFSMIRKEEYDALLQVRLNDMVESVLNTMYIQSGEGYSLQVESIQSSELGKILYEGSAAKSGDINFAAALDSEAMSGLQSQVCDYIRRSFSECYKRIGGEPYYSLDASAKEKKDFIKTVIAVLKQSGAYRKIELLQVPKNLEEGFSLSKSIKNWLRRIRLGCLDFAIGKSEYLLETGWTSETDDKNNVARLSPNMMNLLGVEKNGKIVVSFKDSQVSLRVLERSDLQDFQIGIPAPTRKELGMNGINKIVTVNRDMGHVLRRKSQAQVIALLGTIIAVFRLTNNFFLGLLICAICFPLVLTLALNEERIKVK